MKKLRPVKRLRSRKRSNLASYRSESSKHCREIELDPDLISKLNDAEKEVLTLIASGYTRKEMSEVLAVEMTTISGRTMKAYQKLEINSSAQATQVAIKSGLVAL